MLMRLMSKGEYLIVPKGTKFKGSGKLGLTLVSVWSYMAKFDVNNLKGLAMIFASQENLSFSEARK